MLRFLLPLFVACLLTTPASAQDNELFGPEEGRPSRSSWLIGVNAGIDKPFADMAKRFGTSNRIGGSLQYRLASNWQFGVKGDFLFGSNITDDSLLINLRDPSGNFLNDNGNRSNFEQSERGYQVGLTAEKMLPFSANNPNRGLLLQLGAGFIQHKVFFYNQQDSYAQLRDDYKKGYDRLTNGLYLEPYVGYQHFSDNGLVNFHIGVGATLGFTAGRRNYQYDLGHPLTDARFDGLIGIRGGWIFSIHRKNSEEIYY